MMRKILAIAQTHVYLSFTTPISIVMALVMPVIFTAVLGVAFNDSDPGEDNRTPILLIDEDGGRMVREITIALNNSAAVRPVTDPTGRLLSITRAEALADMDASRYILFVPAGFSQNLLAGQSVTAQLMVDATDQNTTLVEQEITAILDQVSSAVNVAQAATEQAARLQPFASVKEEQAYFETALAEAHQTLANRAIRVVGQTAAGAGGLEANGTDQSSPGNLVTFGLITLLATAIVLVEERNNGTLRRLVTSPLSQITLLTGKILGPLLVGLIQMTILILVGQLVFGVLWGRSPLALTLVVLAFDLAAVSIGIFLSTVVKTTAQATGIMIAASMGMGALGGSWWPLDITPPFMQTIGHFFPSAWAMDGFQSIILRGAGVTEVIIPVLALLGFAVLFFGLGVWRFRYE
jgi:ABC-2 type transport system permease protein